MTNKPSLQERTLSTWAVAGMPATVDVESRSFDIVITTETSVRTWIPNPVTGSFIEADEVLLAPGLDTRRAARMPFVAVTTSIRASRKILGRVDDLRAEGTKVVGKAVLTNERTGLLRDVAEGFFG